MNFQNTLVSLCRSFRAIQNRTILNVNSPVSSAFAVRSKTSLEQSVGLPPRPKRPLTPYFRFLKQIRPTLVEKNPNATTTDITKLIAELWTKIDPTEKEQLEQQFKSEQERYQIQKLKYESQLTPSDRQKLTEARKELVVNKEKKQLRKKRKEFEKPRKNPTAFVLWLQTQLPSRGSQPFRAFQLQSGQKWHTMTDAEKQPFVEQSKKMSEQYKAELTVWEDKMIRLGNLDLVRRQSQIEPEKKRSKE